MALDQGGDCRVQRHTIRRKEANTLNLWKRYVARRHRKEHERVEAERARQKALKGQDAQEAVRDNAKETAIGQGIWGAPGQ
jgi:hypothetical protein